MQKHLDVLVIESHPDAALAERRALTAEGHRVHTCHDPGSGGFPCRGITDEEGCPLDHGVDVALVVRRGVTPRPTSLEHGVSCAVRSGVPLIEDGPTVLDPYEPFLAGRVKGDLNMAVQHAADTGYDRLREAITERISMLLATAGIPESNVTYTFERTGSRLHILLHGVDVPKHIEQAVAVRVLDAARAAGKTYGQIDVSCVPAVAV